MTDETEVSIDFNPNSVSIRKLNVIQILEMAKWLDEHIEGGYISTGTYVNFSKESDALLFRLGFLNV